MAKKDDNRVRREKRATTKVLLVIDEPEDLGQHSKFLQALGYEVMACGSYQRALDQLAREAFDFVAVSQGSARFEGRSVVMQALSSDRSTPVVVLAGSHDMGNYLEAMQLGAVDYLEMPVSAAEFNRVLRTHLRSQRPV